MLGHQDTRRLLETRVAAAPISWGVCEVPGWGVELPPDRVLSEIASLGLKATEAGPVGYLGPDPAAVAARIERHGLELVGGFLPVVLHDRATHGEAIASAVDAGSLLRAAGASFLISAVVVDLDWTPRVPLEDSHWRNVFEGFARLDEAAYELGLTHVTHPHWGTLIEQKDDVARVLEGSDARLCLDTGHLFLGGTDSRWLVGAAGERIAHVHLKDVAGSTGERLRAGELTLVEAVQSGLFRPLGEGEAPVAETIQTLEAGGYEGWYVLEQDCALASGDIPAGEGPIEDVRRSIEFIRPLLAATRATSVGTKG